MHGLTEGRIVHYVLPEGPSIGEHRGAFVAKVVNKRTGIVNLQVISDGPDDGVRYANSLTWVARVPYDDTKQEKGTWHWIEPESMT
jgi:hypothetical protein